MFDLQKKLDERLKLLKNRSKLPQHILKKENLTKEGIIKSLKEAGILDKDGHMIKHIKE